jgi:integrase
MPGHVRDLRKRKSQPYSGRKPWQARWQHPLDPRRRVERSFATKGEAGRWLSDSDADARRGIWADPHKGNVSLGQVAEEWFEANLKRWQEGYAALQRNSLDAWLNPNNDPDRKTDPIGRRYTLTKRKVVSIDTQEVERWRDEVYGPRSLKTARKQFAMLNGIFKFAKQRGYIAVNPCADVSSLVAAPVEHHAYVSGAPAISTEGKASPLAVLSPDEIDALAAAFPHRPYAVAIEFDAWMGLRASELWALTRKDFNLLRGTVTIERGFKEINGHLKVGPLKTSSAYRTIAMPASIRALMTEYLAEYVDPEPDALVFRTVTGAPVRHNTFYRRIFVPTARAAFPDRTALAEAVVQAAAAANAPGRRRKRTEHVPPFRFHDLRHTAASLLIDSIKDASALVVVKERLGHKDIATTVNIYKHLMPQADANIATALDQLRAEHRPTVAALPVRSAV